MIRIFPYHHLDEFDPESTGSSPDNDYLDNLRSRSYAFLPSGREAISLILFSLELKPADEIFITNSTGQLYISSCVTCTVFNFCQPSRVLTGSTRAILIIHEYGLPHPDTMALIAEGRRRGIPVIEDCAHTYDSRLNGQYVGTLGDYAIYSLSKIFPMKSGGIIAGKETLPLVPDSVDKGHIMEIEREFHHYGPFLSHFSQKRQQNFDALRRLFKDHPLLLDRNDGVTPWFFGLFLENASYVRQTTSTIEWGSTLRDDLLLIPTNPLIPTEKLVTTVSQVLQNHA